MKQFMARAYNRFAQSTDKSILSKISNTDRIKDEIQYYIEIHKTNLGHFFPNILNFKINSEKDQDSYFDMEYYPYNNLESYNQDWTKVVDSILNVLNTFREYKINENRHNDFIKYKQKMYIDKTLYYYYELINKFKIFRDLEKSDFIYINNKKFKTIKVIWSDIEDIIQDLLITKDNLCIIHGDLCFSNILYNYDNNDIKLIDPRGSFGEIGIYGDQLYDLAKLKHSFNGMYEKIIYDKFQISTFNNTINYIFTDTYSQECKDAFMSIDLFQDHKLDLIEGLIFLGMCSRHYDSTNRQLVMYATSVEFLNNILKENIL